MQRYAFSEDLPPIIKSGAKADPEVIGTALDKIRIEHGGDLKPKHVVDDCRGKPKHVLHKHFEWNDSKAAEQHRLQQARALIRVVLIVDDRLPADVRPRAFYSIRGDGKSTRYETYDKVISSADLQASLVEQAADDLMDWIGRFRNLKEFLPDARDLHNKMRAKLAEMLAAKGKKAA